MATTINAQNALQIREQPMDVYITLQTGSTATISTYTPSGSYKSYDATLGNTDYSMRNLADLAGDGFPLDGSCVWYDSTVSPSADDGKLGLRGDIGETLTVGISAGSTLTAVTIASSGVSTITNGGTTYTATGNDVVTINASSATLVFTPIDSDTRVEIDFIVPGVMFNITNDTLISCSLALRSNLDVKDHSWEESDIEVKMYYPNDISSSLAYIQSDWPITYQAGYDSDLSDVRKFYLSEPITQEAGVITIKGVDASHLLEQKTIYESQFNYYSSSGINNAHQSIYNLFKTRISQSGITLERETDWASPHIPGGLNRVAIIKETTARDFVSDVMNLTLNHKRGATYYGIQFVDAGIPTVEYGDGTVFGNTWTLYKSDCGEWMENYDQNISKIKETESEHKFNESLSKGSVVTLYTGSPAVNQLVDVSFDGQFLDVFAGGLTGVAIQNSPSQIKFKRTSGSGEISVNGRTALFSGGTTSFTNPNGLAGVIAEMDPIVYGAITDNNGETVFNYPSLFKRSLRTGSFTWKGDPRMQPLDYITVQNDTGDGRGDITARITEIELTHEEGGTSAKITWREWS